jgi:O-antigen/teichoic acid export membrane protein
LQGRSAAAAFALAHDHRSTMSSVRTSSDGGRVTALRNLAWLLADKALALVLGLLVFGLIGRFLGPVGAGHFAYAAAMLQVTLGLAMVCAGSALLPRFCRMHAGLPAALANVFVLRLAASVLAALLAAVYCLLMIDDAERRAVALLMLLAVPLIEPFYVIATYWLSRNHNRPTVIARSSGLIVRAAAVAAGLWWGLPAWVLALAWMFEALINAAIQTAQLGSVVRLPHLAPRLRWSRVRGYFRFGVRFLAAAWLSQLFLRLDRIVLAEWMDESRYGLYATAMQLVEVWVQVSYLVISSLATAFLYGAIRSTASPWRAYRVTAAIMAALGMAGLAGAWLLGPWVLRVVFGEQFAESSTYLVAGAAAAVLLFVDQVVQVVVTARNRPGLLAAKWTVSVAVALAVLWFGYPNVGAYAGPMALALGVLCGWLTVLVAPRGAPRVRTVSAPRSGSSQGARPSGDSESSTRVAESLHVRVAVEPDLPPARAATAKLEQD